MAAAPFDLEFLLQRLTDGTADDTDRQRLAHYFLTIEADAAAAGQNVEYVYANSLVTARALDESKYPSNDWGFAEGGESNGLTWTPTRPSLSEDVPYLLRSERAITGSPAIGDEIEAEWSAPITIGAFGLQATDFWAPFAFALRYDERQQASAASSSGGTWLALTGAAGDVGLHQADLDWSAVTALEFAQKDADGLSWSEQLNGVQLGGATIAIGRREDGARAWVAFDVADGQTIRAKSDGALRVFRIAGLSRAPDVDMNPADVAPTLDEYEVFLLLPALRGGQGRAGVDGWGREDIYAAYEDQDLPTTKYPSNAWPFDEPGTAGGLQWHDGNPPDFGIDKPWLQWSWRRLLGNPLDTPIVGTGELEYALAGLNAGLQFLPASRRITGAPTAVGTSSPTYTVSETDTDHTDTLRFNIKVVDAGGGILGSQLAPNRRLLRGVRAEDFLLPAATPLGGGTISYAIAGLPAGMRFVANQRRVEGTPTEPGFHEVTYSASEQGGGADSIKFFIEVVEPLDFLLFGEAVAPNRVLTRGVSIVSPYTLPAAARRNRIFGPWSQPVALLNWARDGLDGGGKEFIHCLSDQHPLPANQRPDNAWTYQMPGTLNAGTDDEVTWHNDWQEPTADQPYQYIAERNITGQPAPGDEVAAPWGAPALISKFGEDGNGFEFIYATTDTPTLPDAQEPSNAWGFDDFPQTRGGLTWHDDFPGLTPEKPFGWFTKRVVPGQPPVGSAVAAEWDEPRRFGTDGIGLEVIYASTNLDTLPAAKKPDNAWGFDAPGIADGLPWEDGETEVSLANPLRYRSQRRVYGVPNRGDAVPAAWSEPKVVGRYAVPGFDGADGNGVEYKFAVGPWAEDAFPAGLLPDDNAGFNDDDARGPVDLDGEMVSLTWTDGGQSVTEEDRYLYRVQRSVPGTPANGTVPPTARTVPPSNALPGTTLRPLIYHRPLKFSPTVLAGRYRFRPADGEFAAVPTWAEAKTARRFSFSLIDSDGTDRTAQHRMLGDGSVFVYYVAPDQWIAWNVDGAEIAQDANGRDYCQLTLGDFIGSADPADETQQLATRRIELRFRPAAGLGWSGWSAPRIVGTWGNRGLDGKPGFGGKNYAITYDTLAVGGGDDGTLSRLGDFGHWRMTRPTSPDDDTQIELPTEDNWDEALESMRISLNYRDKDGVDVSEALKALQINDIIAAYVDETQWIDFRIISATPAAHAIEFAVRQLEDLTPETPASLPANGDVTFYLSRAPVPAAVSAEATFAEHRFAVERRLRIPLRNEAAPAQPAAGAAIPLSVDPGGPYATGVGEFLLVNAFARGGRPPYRFTWPELPNDGRFAQFGNGYRARYEFLSAGARNGMVTVTDAAGDTAQAAFAVAVGAEPVELDVAIVGPSQMTVGERAWFATTERGTARYRGADTWAWSAVGANGRVVTNSATDGASVHMQAVAAGTYDVRVRFTRGAVSRTVTKRITVVAAPDAPAAGTVHPYFYAKDAVDAPEAVAALRWHRGEELVAARDVTVRLKPSNPELIEVFDVAEPNPGDDPIGLAFDAQEGTAIQLVATHKHSNVRQVVRWIVDLSETSSRKGPWAPGVEYSQFYGPVAKVEGYDEDSRVESDGRVQQGDIVTYPWDVPITAAAQATLRRPYIPTEVRFQARETHLATVDNPPLVDATGPRQNVNWNPVFQSDTAPQLPSDIGPYERTAGLPIALVLAEAVGGNPPLAYELFGAGGSAGDPRLPDWMNFDAAQRLISGTPPAAAAPVTLTYKVSDSDTDAMGDPSPQTDTHEFTLEAVAPPDSGVVTVLPLYQRSDTQPANPVFADG